MANNIDLDWRVVYVPKFIPADGEPIESIWMVSIINTLSNRPIYLMLPPPRDGSLKAALEHVARARASESPL